MSSIIFVLINDVIVAGDLTGDQKVTGSIPVRDSESFSERTAWERAY